NAQHWDVAGEMYERAANAGCNQGMAWYNAACCYALGGHRNRAVGAMHQALEEGFTNTSVYESDDDLATVHSDRRFQMLLQAAQHGGVADVRKEKHKDVDEDQGDN